MVRSACTILLYAALGPLLGAGFYIGMSEGASLLNIGKGVVVAFAGTPFVGLLAYRHPSGAGDRMLVGSHFASGPHNHSYVAFSTMLGGAMGGLIGGMLGLGGNRLLLLAGTGAFAALVGNHQLLPLSSSLTSKRRGGLGSA